MNETLVDIAALRLGGRRVPIVGNARMYVCGITPYEATHLGHAATFVWADLAARVVASTGTPVTVCRNITDIDDHLLAEAQRRSDDWRALATREGYRFEEDMRELGVRTPAFEPQSHNYVEEVLQLAGALLEQGGAYERDGTVWFRGAGLAAAAGLDDDTASALLAEAGDDPGDPAKEHPFDVAVWQASGDDEPAWPSAYGPGRPGWHAQCAAMALSTLGPGIDVHCGGADLAFPHHAYERAMAEAAVGVRPFARAWMHVGAVRVGGRKMAKSLGNLVFVHDLLERWSPQAVRLLILSRWWSEPWDFDERELAHAAQRVERLHHWGGGGGDEALERAALAVLVGDLDVSGALEIASAAGGATLRRVAELVGVA